MTIYEKLSAIQAEVSVPKGQYNSFGKYKYRSCEDILAAVKPIAKKHGVLIVVGDTLVHEGDRYYIEATAMAIDTADGTTFENTAYAREDETKKGMDGSQITGTASSYARKYALNGLLGLDDVKDADTDEFKNQQEPKESDFDDANKLRDKLIAIGGGDAERVSSFAEKLFPGILFEDMSYAQLVVVKKKLAEKLAKKTA